MSISAGISTAGPGCGILDQISGRAVLGGARRTFPLGKRCRAGAPGRAVRTFPLGGRWPEGPDEGAACGAFVVSGIPQSPPCGGDSPLSQEGRGDSRLGRPPPHPALRTTFPPVGGRLCGRPHGAAPTNPNERGGLTPPHPAQCTHWATFPPRGRSGAPGRPRPSSSQTPYRSLPPDGESSLIPLLLLSPSNPRLPPLGFGGDPKNYPFSIFNYQFLIPNS